MAKFSFLKGRAAMLLSVLLIVQASLFYGFSRGETPPSYRPLDGFPTEIGIVHERRYQLSAQSQVIKRRFGACRVFAEGTEA